MRQHNLALFNGISDLGEELHRCLRVQITSLMQRLDHPVLIRHVCKNSQLKLRIVRHHERLSSRRREAASDLGPPGNGLEVGVAAAQAPGGGGHSDARVDPPLRCGVSLQRPCIRPELLPQPAKLRNLRQRKTALLRVSLRHPAVDELLVGEPELPHLGLAGQHLQHLLLGRWGAFGGDAVLDHLSRRKQADTPDHEPLELIFRGQ
mmetsp:Transcript_91320/g.244530  ORF Transcript_91320/g.244530 Transcript_91320/m.244530 type:complete len:206 (-) Transcript_91320:1296-1913(-)